MEEFSRVPKSQLAELGVFLKRFGLFWTVALTLFLLLNARFESQVDQLENLHYQELRDPKVRADVVILGSSHGSCGIDPRFLEKPGRSVYNFSTGGAGPDFYEKWMVLFAKHYPKPKLVIYTADWFTYRDTPYLKKLLEHDSELLTLEEFTDLATDSTTDQRDLWTSRFMLFQHRQSLGKLFGEPTWSHCLPLDQAYNGYVPSECPTTKPGFVKAPVVEERKRAFLELMAYFKQQGTPVIWVQIPEFVKGRGFDPACQAELEALAKELEIPFLNYNTRLISEINADGSNFVDWAHLSRKGAELFGPRFAKDLEQFPEWTEL